MSITNINKCNKTLTVFTPSYNRAYTLHKCYESLIRQTSKDFRWLIIDDGSTDDTKELVDKWISEGKVEINYVYQENKGMHGAHNTAYSIIDTELNTCIDSDDYMKDDAVEIIVDYWKKNKSKKLAGLVALDVYTNGEVVGTKFPKGIDTCKYFDLYNKYNVKGDKKFIYRTDLTRLYPYPIFEGEKYVSLAYKYVKLDEKYNLGLINEVVCVVEYMQDGSSLNMINQYRKNPRGFAFIRVENMKNPQISTKHKFKECIHYVSSSIISKNFNAIKESPEKLFTIMAIPFGILLWLYIMLKTYK